MLKPCPYCNVGLLECTYNGGDKRWSHEANDCVNSRRFIYEHQVASWNHRPNEQALIAALKSLLHCPAIADGDHSNLEWGCQETVDAERKARQALEKAGVK